MMYKKITLYLLLILYSFTLLSCSKDSDKDVLTQRVNSLIKVIESHDEKNMRDYFSKDFLVVKKFNKEKFFLFARYHLKRNKNISINVINKEIRFNESRFDTSRFDISSADVITDVVLLGAENWLPQRGQRYYVESRWVKEDGDWVMSRLRWSIKQSKIEGFSQ